MYDISRLTRNYDEYPLKPKETIPEADLHYLFIECNLCCPQIVSIVHKSASAVTRACKKYGLTKSAETQKQSLRAYYLATLEVENPAQLQSSRDKTRKTLQKRYGVTYAR